MKTLRRLSLATIASLLLACALQAQAQTNAPSGGVIRREGEPDCVQITEDNKAMDRAVQKAQKTVKKFIAAIRSPKASQSRFAIKKPFVEGDKVEHIWLNEVSFDGSLFHGKVDNEPVDIKGLRVGQEVSVSPNEISDWMYVQAGRLLGGYTICAMCQNMSPAEKKQFEEDAHCQIK
jgi:uncharacterized protein YegJ (DUF2314 family)